jgi:hypothetical protein
MRDLTAKTNVIEVKDAVAGVVHELYYRTPTTSERAKFRAQLFERLGNKIINRTLPTQEKFGALILEGFKPGTFAVDGKAISSDATDPNYYEEWKKLIVKAAPELLVIVARVAFDGAEAVLRPDHPAEIVVEELEDDLGE